MTALMKWNPFREMDELQNRLSSWLGTSTLGRADGREGDLAVWAPAVDIEENDKEYLIKAELPDLKKDEVNVRVEHGVLTITGERKFEKEDKGRRYHRIERAYGRFERSFTLPEDADSQKVSADFKDGLLKVHVLKSEQAKPRSIEVKVA